MGRSTGHSWEMPEVMLEQLDALAAKPATAGWSGQVERLVGTFGSAVATESDEADLVLQRLQELASQAPSLAEELEDKPLAGKLRRLGHALKRRLDVWREAVQIGRRGPLPVVAPQLDPEQLSLCLAEIDEITGDTDEGKAWRDYLLIDALREWSTRRPAPEDRRPRRLAQQVLRRLTEIPLSIEQRRFVSGGPLAALRAELRRWAAEPVSPAGLLGHLERYERTGLSSDARVLAEDCLHLSVSPTEERRRLAERLQTHYRNANLRVAVTQELLSRLVPQRDPEYARVRDTVLGVPVRGESMTSTDVTVQMLPDPNRVSLALEISGQVAALTRSTSGPATFYNDSESTYAARKPMQVDLRGIHLGPAEVSVSNDMRLRGVRTEFDAVPLVGPLVKGVARSQHQQQRPAAAAEVRRKIANRARQRVDSEADARLGRLSERLQRRVLDPLNAMSLDPTMIDAETTDRRLTMRIRLAGEDQLGSHTPRPRAPSDSLASFQVHQSAVNNVIGRLELDGRTFSLPGLAHHLAARFNRPQLLEVEPADEDVSITFATQDAVGVRCEDGRIVLTLAIAKLSKGRRRWRSFQVRAFYRPQVEGRSVELARDGVIHLIGQRLSTGSQIALRGIFSKTFSKKRPWKVVPESLAENPKLADLAITQFVVDDGWIGVALGPQRTAGRAGWLRR